MQTLPRNPRVVVVGTSAAGKTTFARGLAAALGVSCVELDELNWSSDWREKPRADFLRRTATYPHITWLEFKAPAEAAHWLAAARELAQPLSGR